MYHEISGKKGLILIFLVPFLFLMALQVYIKYTAPIMLFVCFLLFAGALFYYLIQKRKIIIDDMGITNQLLFKKVQYIPWKEITKSSIEWQNSILFTSYQWVFKNNSTEKVSIMIYNYSRKDLQLIAETLLKKCPTIRVDPKIKDLAEGKYPLYNILN